MKALSIPSFAPEDRGLLWLMKGTATSTIKKIERPKAIFVLPEEFRINDLRRIPRLCGMCRTLLRESRSATTMNGYG